MLPPAGAGEYSIFQGFSLNVFSVIPSLQHICRLPPTISELFLDRDDALRMRASGLGGYAVAMLDLEFLQELREGFPYTVFVSASDTRDEVEHHVQQHGRQGWLHPTTGQPAADIRSLAMFTRAEMFAWNGSDGLTGFGSWPEPTGVGRAAATVNAPASSAN